MKLIFTDTETTGLKNPRVVELAYSIEGVMTVLRCNPGKPIELDATVVNGIRNQDVEHLPLLQDCLEYPALKKLLEESTVVAHNAVFDIEVLANDGIIVKRSVCTKELAMKRWPNAPKHRLQHLRYWLNLDVEAVAHTADGDVMVLMALWDAIHKNPGIDTYRADEMTSSEPPPSQSPQRVRKSGSSENFGPSPSRTHQAQLRKRIEGRKSLSKKRT